MILWLDTRAGVLTGSQIGVHCDHMRVELTVRGGRFLPALEQEREVATVKSLKIKRSYGF